MSTTWKKEICVFSGFPIYPGHGRRYVPASGNTTRPVLPLFSTKCSSLFHSKKNPRKIRWTVQFRRLHKKGLKEESVKRRARKVKKVQRSYVGLSLEEIEKKKVQRPAAFSSAQRDAAQKEKEARKAKAEQQKKIQKLQPKTKSQTAPVAKSFGGKGR